ncbi:hypothetical protein [Rhizobium oryzicola]|uniref:Transposase n=1 Tax=Rhizobium oryzicola TaxID=1232668 RepID=A0ABT8SY50_9HYPH|nr:hypothetical protein [Rhizobium oryzicola]MDO1583362.1 hypothetical protein [Rhizobium oryzicola]
MGKNRSSMNRRGEARYDCRAPIKFTMPAGGFEIVRTEDPIAGAQVIRIDWENGTLTGASLSRKDGIALDL